MDEALKTVREALKAPISTILVVTGLVFLLFSFVRIADSKISLLVAPTHWMLWIGLCLLFIGILLFLFLYQGHPLIGKVDLAKGLVLKNASISVTVKLGYIQEITDNASSSAVVLPANTDFVDDCILDPKTALGAFFQKHYIKEMSTATIEIKRALDAAGLKPIADGAYAVGTTVILLPPFTKPCSVLLTASTERKPLDGFKANPTTVCECVKNILAVTANKRIDKIYMPIIGSGHGGLGGYEALMFLVLSFLHYSGKKHHHIKQVEILVLPSEKENFKQAYRLRHIPLLEDR